VNDEVILLLLLAGGAWFWWESRGVVERANVTARTYCDNAGVEFLNDTVAWQRYRLVRNRDGRLKLQRTYFFEFASDMQQRYRGEIVMLGRLVQSITLDPYRVG
jgi:hypothetical protein